MKIVHCIYSFCTGGAETMLIDIVNEQVKTEDVTLIIVNDFYQTYLLKQISPDVKVIKLHRKRRSYSLFPIIKLNWLLYQLAPDVVHVHNPTLLSVIVPCAGRERFLTVHDLHVPMKHAGRGVRLIAISEAVAADILQRSGLVATVIPNGITVNKIAKHVPNTLITRRCMRIVQVARLEMEKKGQDILIQAVALLKKRGITNIEVDLIGEGQSEQALRQLAQQLSIDNQVNFLGLCDRQYIYSHLKDYDLMCHPSRYEGFGLTVAEGIAAMLPILVSDEGGPYEIIKHGELGYTFRMEDAVDCADKIEYIYHNYSTVIERTNKAYCYIVEKFSVERMVSEYIKTYRHFQL